MIAFGIFEIGNQFGDPSNCSGCGALPLRWGGTRGALLAAVEFCIQNYVPFTETARVGLLSLQLYTQSQTTRRIN